MFDSDMGAREDELGELLLLDEDCDEWNYCAKKRSSNFGDTLTLTFTHRIPDAFPYIELSVTSPKLATPMAGLLDEFVHRAQSRSAIPR
ncbi:hypothetical protein E0H73_38985 [Kribbella pittospori]|uniref:Uncharacterized protein n=1 Tax=Kribbella pittospori TaxID=722689 RepID=A0A4R0K6G8_9ACTN|nr:hypothetical protein [Kribbella pittospori]TCC54434.1 hypothetical protein E0H73_38985 [Kribbella pittospori]